MRGSLRADGQAPLIKLQHDIQLERDTARSPGRTECMSVCGRQETKDTLYFREISYLIWQQLCYHTTRVQADYLTCIMHEISAGNKELRQPNRTTPCVHAVMNY